MAQRDDFRKNSTFDLRPVFISLGLPQSSFKVAGLPRRTSLFDTTLNADVSRPDTLWLFKGSDYFAFNLRTGSFESDAKQIAGNWGGNSWPAMFSSGIDGAVWAGPAYPNLWYFFKDNFFIRLDSNQGGGSWLVNYGPRGILGEWASGAWAAPDGTWKTPGVPVALHGLSPKFHGMIHFFKDGQYIRHNLNTGGKDAGLMPIKDAWNLPEEFSNKIEMAFYGTGMEEQQIYFFSGAQCALYDTKTDETIKLFPIEERFPAFAEFMIRPQLFLVEDYQLETYTGPPQLGRLVETKNVLPGAETKALLVTETIDSSQTTLHYSILDRQDSSVVNNFNKQMDKRAEQVEGSEKYGYHMNAKAHADASANSLWGGEVNASLNVQGGSESLRSNIAESAFETIKSQVTEATAQINQRTYDSTAAIQHMERVLKQEEIVLKNPTDRLRVFEFYQQLQPYITLLVLKNVRIAYTDGTEAPRIVKMSSIVDLLNNILANDEDRNKLMQFIANELSTVADQDGQPHSLIQKAEAHSYEAVALLGNSSPTFLIQHANGDVQKIVTQGLVIKAAKDWLAPTLNMIAVERIEA